MYSDYFSVTNGVKQGGIISPLLFCIYIDVLFDRLKDSNVGCHIGHYYVGCIGYADDVCLMAPSCNAMRIMLNICDTFGAEYNVNFNSSKSQSLVCFNNQNMNCDVQFQLSGNNICQCQHITHLGHTVETDRQPRVDINKGISDLIMRTNYVMSKFGCCSADLRNFLFRTYCTSYYGSPLWNLSGSYINRLHCTWRKCMRRIWSIPYNSHCFILKYLYGSCDSDIQLLSRFLKFIHGALRSDNCIVSLCAKLTEQSQSVVARNRRLLLYKLKDNGDTLSRPLNNAMLRLKLNAESQTHQSIALSIKELCIIRDDELVTDLSCNEINIILNELCVN